MNESRVRAAVQGTLDFRWEVLIRPRLEGLTDEEYLWEPAPGSLTVKPDGSGGFVLDPVQSGTTPLGNIAWRMAHLTYSFAAHPVAAVAFGSDWPRAELHAPAGDAATALARLDAAYAHWHGTVAAIDDSALWRKLGPAAAPYHESTVLDIIDHVQAEALQRGADLCLLRDLYEHLHAG